MKFALLTLLISSPIFAQNTLPVFCDSSEARLSLTPKPCIGDQVVKFDIPALKLQIEDIRKILEGAESSGGRLAPNTGRPPNIGGMSTLMIPTHECQARLLLDGGVRVSWLLTSEFRVKAGVPLTLPTQIWDSGLILGNDMNEEPVAFDELPTWGLDSLSVNVENEELTVCAEGSCSTSELSSPSTLSLYRSNATLKFKVSCQEL